MGFFEGFQAAMTGTDGMELFERAYQDFALTQPNGIFITFFYGYKCHSEVLVGRASEYGNEGYMFIRFSGNELPWHHKTKILARAVHKIENQAGAIKRQPGSYLSLPYFQWDEIKEKDAQMLEMIELKLLCEKDQTLARSIEDMEIELIDDKECNDWLLKTFTGITKPDLMSWLSTGYEHLMIKFMDIKPETLTEDQFDCYRKSGNTATLEEFKKIVADTQLRMAFMAF